MIISFPTKVLQEKTCVPGKIFFLIFKMNEKKDIINAMH